MGGTPVIELVSPQPLGLRTPGFESCVIEPPSWLSEDALRSFYDRPARANAFAFVNELLATCVEPRRRPGEFAALPDDDRARLRRLLVVVCKREKQWRSLYGSALTLDERLFAVMFWRHLQAERFRARLIERRRELEAQAAAAGLAGVTVPTLDIESATAGVSVALAERVPNLPDYTSWLPKSLSPALWGGFEMGGLSKAIKSMSAISSFAALPGRLGYVHAPSMMLGLSSSKSFAPLGIGETNLLKSLRDVARVPGVMGLQSPGLANLLREQNRLTQVGLNISRTLGLPGGFPELSVLTTMRSAGESLTRLLDPFRGWRETMEEVEAVARVWERRALWYLLSRFGLAVLRRLAGLAEPEVEDAVLYALEGVLSDGPFTPALRRAVAEAPHLTSTQREQLDHMLELTAQGRYVLASPLLYVALEGAFWQVGYAHTVVTAERRHPENHNKTVQFESFVKLLVRRFDLEPELQTLIVRELYGTAGNPYRHGGVTGEERRKVLFGIVALCGWLESFAEQPALTALGSRMAEALPEAIGRAQRLALPPGA